MPVENPQQNPPVKSPEKYRLALVVSGVVLGVLIACVFSLFSRGPVNTFDLIFWAIGGGVIGFFAGVRDPRKKPDA